MRLGLCCCCCAGDKSEAEGDGSGTGEGFSRCRDRLADEEQQGELSCPRAFIIIKHGGSSSDTAVIAGYGGAGAQIMLRK
jgi:hypothetical protein